MGRVRRIFFSELGKKYYLWPLHRITSPYARFVAVNEGVEFDPLSMSVKLLESLDVGI